ncbi:DUF2911 domain-containing protein [Chondrinema litorale]|uniref:DUF2911 domain-containing protein n=1 Tax=Chondrinema litorale TaxID=2994555 RepID=UPI0025431BD3|nr:DUF2911 domain-containing protein [Chondrinema litorale]UZR98404.1 DUF2911 domain-containing protein [Chondrinema litorale]
MNTANLKFILAIAFLGLLSFSGNIQAQDKKIQPSQKASVTQFIGNDTEITFTFSRPGVKGRKIYGGIVPFGMEPANKYSEKPFPWRAGANENTTIEVSTDVKIEGQPLAAGKYSIHTIPGEKEWVVIFNKVNDQWGSYKYDEKMDALRIKVASQKAPFEEWLNYGFGDITDNSTIAYFHWEKLKVPFKIETAEQTTN